MKSNRRNFLKFSGLTGIGFAGANMMKAYAAHIDQDAIRNQLNKTHNQQFNMSGYAAPKLDTVRIGFIGLGNRGPAHLDQTIKVEGMEVKALCDLRADRVDEAKKRLEGTRHNPVLYTGNIDAWMK